MANRDEVELKARQVLAEQLSIDIDKIIPEARFGEDLNADSLDLVEATLQLEEDFGIEIPESEMENIKTVKQTIDLIFNKLGI